MAITSLNLNQQNDLEFSVAVSGANSNNAKTRFCIVTEDKEIGFTGLLENGSVKFCIPKLESLLEAGTYECKLEIMVDEYYFMPISETIEFKMPVSVSEAKVVDSVEPKEKPSVSINKMKVSESAPVEQSVTTAEHPATVTTTQTVKQTVKAKPIDSAKQYKIAKLVAESLKYKTKPTQTPTDIINESLTNSPNKLSRKQASLLNNMLKAASQASIDFDKNLLGKIKIL